MKLIVDENIPAAEAFAQFGEVTRMPGRAIDANAVRSADVLIVRSVTRVDAALLGKSRVRFVGSATAGVDHVNQADLVRLGIRFAAAPGSNADSVVDYVLAALALRFGGEATLSGRTVGIVGCGNVGGRLLARLRGLGIHCVVRDPFLPPDAVEGLCSFEKVLGADVLSLHVPLRLDAPHATRHLIGAAEIEALRPGAFLLNTSRGVVVDNAALLEALARRPDLTAALDVWESEPDIDRRLLERVLIGTPHIAGYAFDGKLRGVAGVYEALCEFLGAGAAVSALPVLQTPPAGRVDAASLRGGVLWQRAALACYDLLADDRQLRQAIAVGSSNPAAAFDRLRRDYPLRREFSAWRIVPDAAMNAAELAQLRAAGFSA